LSTVEHKGEEKKEGSTKGKGRSTRGKGRVVGRAE
jgi:hypothetical protein